VVFKVLLPSSLSKPHFCLSEIPTQEPAVQPVYFPLLISLKIPLRKIPVKKSGVSAVVTILAIL
jgi:hypothetical protein